MKNLLLALLFMFCSVSLCADNIRLAILEFENNTGRKDVEHLKKGLRDFFVTDMQGIQGVILIERGRIDEVLKEIKLNKSEFFDQNTAAKLGKQMGASHVLTGSYFCLHKKWRMDIRVVKTETGEVILAAQENGTEDDFFDMEKILAEKMAKQLKPTISRRELRIVNKDHTGNYRTFDKYSQAVDRKDKGDVQGAVQLMEEIVQEDPAFSLAADNLKKYRKLLLDEIAAHAKKSLEQKLSDREYVDQDFKNALNRIKLYDGSSDYYVSLMLAALHYGLRNRDGKYRAELEQIFDEYDVQFLCKKHSSKALQEIAEKLHQRLTLLEERLFEQDKFMQERNFRANNNGNGSRKSIRHDRFKKYFQDFIPENSFDGSHGGVMLYWPGKLGSYYQMWTIRPARDRKDFDSSICSLYFIANHYRIIPAPITARSKANMVSQRARNSIAREMQRMRMAQKEWSLKLEMKTQRKMLENYIERYIGTSVEYFILTNDRFTKNKFRKKTRLKEIKNWSEILIVSLRFLAQYEQDGDKRAEIQKVLVSVIDAKKELDRRSIPIDLLLKKAEQGDAESQYNVGIYYSEGIDVSKDLKKSYFWINKAADQGHIEAQRKMGYIHLTMVWGWGMRNLQKSVFWFSKAAEQGDVESQYQLGNIYHGVWGTAKKDLSKAKIWYRKAAQQGHKEAQNALRSLK